MRACGVTEPSGADPSDGGPPAVPPAEVEQARAFAVAFQSFLEWVQSAGPTQQRSPVSALLADHLGDRVESSVLTRLLPPFEQVNLQVALDAWSVEAGRRVDISGLARPPHSGPLGLGELLHGQFLHGVRLCAPDLVDLPAGPYRSLAVLTLALLRVTDARGAYVLLVRGPQPHEDPRLVVEVAGLAAADAQAVLRELADLRRQHNVYRGQLLELVAGDGGVSVGFPVLAPTRREDVVLPEQVLRRIERHTLDMAARRADLQAAGQHLKRGLLLHGPPGTGKTHTVRYLVQHLAGSTVLLLSGRSLHLVGEVTALARELQPAVVVLEDVDLVAEDRSYGPGPSPVLFELLDAMDGSAADADLLFLLTTNRADLLEPALAARPGRVDVAVEIGLPDADGRRRLLELYAAGVPHSWTDADLGRTVERTAGVTASFVKELLRRAVLEALAETPGPLQHVDGPALDRALDDLLDSTSAVTRALLGVPGDQSGPPSEGGAAHPGVAREYARRGGHDGVGWFAPGAAPTPYGSSLEITFDEQ